jgi:hypothetical protein
MAALDVSSDPNIADQPDSTSLGGGDAGSSWSGYAQKFGPMLAALGKGSGGPNTGGDPNDPAYDPSVPDPSQESQQAAFSSGGSANTAKGSIPMPRLPLSGGKQPKMAPASGKGPSLPAGNSDPTLGTAAGLGQPDPSQTTDSSQPDASQPASDGSAAPQDAAPQDAASQDAAPQGALPGGQGVNGPAALGGQIDPKLTEAMDRFSHLHSRVLDAMSPEDRKQQADDTNTALKQTTKGRQDLESTFGKYYNKDLEQQQTRNALVEQQARKVSTPTWGDKAAYVLDVMARTAMIQQMYPRLNGAQALTLATGFATQAYHDRLAGLHDASIAASKAYEAHAQAAGDQAVKRAQAQGEMDLKGSQADEASGKGDEARATAGKTRALTPGAAEEQASIADKNRAEAEKARADAEKARSDAKTGKAASKKGDLLTDKDGNTYVLPPGATKADVVTGPDGKPLVGGKKLAPEPKPQDDTVLQDKAAARLEKIEATMTNALKESAKSDVLGATRGQYKIDANKIHQQALAQLKNDNPDLYAAYVKNSKDAAAPGAQQPVAAGAPATKQPPLWAR